MSNSGYIILNRATRDDLLWTDKPFSRGQAWIDMLMMANHKDNTVIINGIELKLKAGEFITSQLRLFENWGWSRHKVADFIAFLAI